VAQRFEALERIARREQAILIVRVFRLVECKDGDVGAALLVRAND
jgi:hypothetical protein